MGYFVFKKTATGVKFDLVAGNHEVIATSEVYKSEPSCRKGIASVRRNAPIANLQDMTEEPVVKVSCPKFEVYVDKGGEYRFRLKATNGQIIAVSEGYADFIPWRGNREERDWPQRLRRGDGFRWLPTGNLYAWNEPVA